MQGTYIPQYTPVPPTAVPIEVSLSPSMKVEWRGSRTFIYYAFLHLLFERGQKVLYGVVAGSFQLFKWELHISFSFCFLSFLFLLFSNPSFLFFKIICKGSCFAFVLLYSRTWNKNISDYDYFFPMYLGGRWEETGKQTQQADHETKRNFKKRRLQEGLMRSLASIGNCWNI